MKKSALTQNLRVNNEKKFVWDWLPIKHEIIKCLPHWTQKPWRLEFGLLLAPGPIPGSSKNKM